MLTPFKRFEPSQGWQFILDYDISADGYRLFVKYGADFALPMAFTEPMAVGAFPPPREPFIASASRQRRDDNLPDPNGQDFLRAALNAAWELGMRPDGFDDTRESMKATAAHLEDMRAIAFHKVGAPVPQSGTR